MWWMTCETSPGQSSKLGGNNPKHVLRMVETRFYVIMVSEQASRVAPSIRKWSRIVLSTICLAIFACRQTSPDERSTESSATKRVVIYCSVDEFVARPILDQFARQTGIEVQAVFDSEAGKTTGLVSRIVAEARSGRPRADVFWSGEVFNTILLSRQGHFLAHDFKSAADIPSPFRDPEGRWTAYALRARVLAYDPRVTADSELPTHWEQLAQPEFAARTAIANPLFGTTRGHVAAMFAQWGRERGRRFLTGMSQGGASIADGNSATVRAVIAGTVRFAATDTDDVWAAQKSGATLACRYLEMDTSGAFWIPFSVAVIAGAPNREEGKTLADFLVSAETERTLAQSISRNDPVRPELRKELGLAPLQTTTLNYQGVADAMDDATASVREILLK